MPDTIYEAWASGAGSGAKFEGSGLAAQEGSVPPTAKPYSASEREASLLKIIDDLKRAKPESQLARENLELVERNKELANLVSKLENERRSLEILVGRVKRKLDDTIHTARMARNSLDAAIQKRELRPNGEAALRILRKI